MTDYSVNRRAGAGRILFNFALLAVLGGLWLISTVVVCGNLGFGLAGTADPVLLFAFTGIYFSRWSIVALLIALLPGSFSIRGLIATMVFGVEAVVMAMLPHHNTDPILLFLQIPWILFAMGLPLGVARLVWNWRLEVDWFDFVRRRQMGIKAMLVWVTAAAILFGIVRLAEKDQALVFFSSGLGLSLITAVLILPFTFRVMTGRRRALRFFLILIVVNLIAFGITLLIEKFSGPLNGNQRAIFPVGLSAYLTSYGLGLFLLQRMGMRLETG